MMQIEGLLDDVRAVLAKKAVDRIAPEDLVAALVGRRARPRFAFPAGIFQPPPPAISRLISLSRNLDPTRGEDLDAQENISAPR